MFEFENAPGYFLCVRCYRTCVRDLGDCKDCMYLFNLRCSRKPIPVDVYDGPFETCGSQH